jgi:hypothetical protein
MSILSVDFGSVNTRAILIDLVDGVYQLIARAQTRTTDGFPVNDINVGLDRVLRDLSDATGRTLTTGDGRVLMPERTDRAGVDVFTATASTGRPLRAVILGLVPDISAASAIRAASGTYVDVAAIIHLEDRRDEQERLNAILLSNPDVILLAGGTERGAEAAVLQMAELARLAIGLMPEQRRPTVIFAGNSDLHGRLTTLFEGVTELLFAPNVRPTLREETLGAAKARLGQAFDLYKEQRSADFTTIAEMSKAGIRPTAQGYPTIIHYLGQARKTNVMVVDVGSAASVLTASIKGATTSAIRTDLGLGHNALNLLDAVDKDLLRRWLPFNISNTELLNYAANKAVRPASVPLSLKEVYIEHAMLKVAVQTLLKAARPTWKKEDATDFGIIIGAGSALNGVGHPGYTALLLLDAVQPTGVSMLYSDPFALVPALGAVVEEHPEAVVQVLDGNSLEAIGLSFSLSGTPRLDKPAFNVKITLANGEVIEQTVLGGHLWVYPLPIGQSAELRVRVLGRGLSLNGKSRLRMKAEGGAAGLIFDARGRTLTMAADVRERAVHMPQWVSEVTGDRALVIDPQWLEEIAPERAETSKPQRQEGRRGLFRRRQKQVVTDDTDFLLDDDLLSDEDKNDTIDDLRKLRDASLS